jgi:hypothetical protein
MATNNSPDLLYQLPRESLLLFEDARLLGLLQAVANYYSPRNDQPFWGAAMRAIAQELARLEYDYQYDILGSQPQYLTPPDIKRRFAAPLYIKSAYPYPAQFDKGDFTGFGTLDNPVGYRDMLVDLIGAYQEGATAQSIADVIYAYTGKTVTVVELYKLIGQGVYDQSDRNAIQVSVNVGGSNPLSSIQSLTQLQEVVENLYGAIDLAKPAHVGLEFATVFAETEKIALSISDTLRIIIQQVEAPPIDPMLWVAPIFNVKHPKTTLAAWGRKMATTITQAQWLALQLVPAFWDASASYSRGALVQYPPVESPPQSPPQPAYQMYRALKKNVGQVPPTSPAYWKPLPSPAAWQAYYPIASGMYTLGMAPWTALSPFYTGQFVVDPNGNLEIATQGGTSGSSVTFNPETGGITYDGNVVWLNLGANYLNDPSTWIQVVDNVLSPPAALPTGEVANWNVNNPMGLVAPRESAVWEVKSDTLTILTMD